MPDLTKLRVSLVQADLAWHDREANLRRFDGLLRPLAGQTDLIVLPEMFTTGFTMAAAEVAEPANGPTVEWMRARAAELGAALTGSVVTHEGGRYFNRLVWMSADGRPTFYDKRHLFRMAREHEHYSAGDRRVVVGLGAWKVRPLVCYDLRFPVWSRNRIGRDEGYDLLIYVANWPERRRHAWRSLLPARAIENLSYCVGVNRVGRDGHDIPYAGDSAAFDHLGQPLLSEWAGEGVHTATLDRSSLLAFRERFPAQLDADEFSLDE
jgi:omega-amidase